MNTFGASAKAETSSGKREEFVALMHGYERLPTHEELCELAAAVGNEVPGETAKSQNEARRRVMLAMEIWEAAGRVLVQKSRAVQRTEELYEKEVQPLFGPLKVGNHFLPLVVQWKADWHPHPASGRPRIRFEEFLETVVGMQKEEDRMRWWRAYLTAKQTGPEGAPGIADRVAAIIQRMKTGGITEAKAGLHLEDYRRWRLTMKTPVMKAPVPYDLEECFKKGLAMGDLPDSGRDAVLPGSGGVSPGSEHGMGGSRRVFSRTYPRGAGKRTEADMPC